MKLIFIQLLQKMQQFSWSQAEKFEVAFLETNRHRYKNSGELKINDNGLTAVALLVAQSKPDEKEIIIQLIISLISESIT